MKIFSILFLPVIVLSLVSCGDSIKSGLEKQLTGTDSIKVYFFDEKSNSVEKVVTVTEKSGIDEIISSISDESSEQFKCGYNGQMEFYKGGDIILSPQFNTGDGCEHYVFRFKDRMYHKAMTAEGKQFLEEQSNK